MVELRDYQTTTLEDIRQAIRDGCNRPMVQMPTGAGKTKLAASMVKSARGKNKRIIFEVPAISLVDQTVESFHNEGIHEIGVIQANHYLTDWSKPIQVASVQTLQQRELPRCDLVIRDEAHRLFMHDEKWMLDESWAKVPQIGLSATPWTRGLGRFYQRLVVGTTTSELIAMGYLVPFKVFAPTSPDLTGVRTVAGDYAVDDLSAVMNKSKLVGDIIQTWIERAEGRPTICFAVDRAHANSLCERFNSAGVSAEYMDCNTPLPERRAVYRRFKRGETRVVCNVEVIGIGVDWPEIACISYCRPTKSEMRFVQNIGRGLRLSMGKDDLLILDHSDTHLRLGFVTDIAHRELNDGRAPPKQVANPRLPKMCPKCNFVKPFGVRVCPQCGFETAAPPPIKEYTAAQLAEFAGKKRRGKQDITTWGNAEKAIFYAELKRWVIEYNKKPGWAFMRYKARFDGVPPDRSFEDVAPADFVSHATRKWIKSENIRYWRGVNGGAYAPH